MRANELGRVLAFGRDAAVLNPLRLCTGLRSVLSERGGVRHTFHPGTAKRHIGTDISASCCLHGHRDPGIS